MLCLGLTLVISVQLSCVAPSIVAEGNAQYLYTRYKIHAQVIHGFVPSADRNGVGFMDVEADYGSFIIESYGSSHNPEVLMMLPQNHDVVDVCYHRSETSTSSQADACQVCVQIV